MTTRPSDKVVPLRIHCQIWLRAISAVAASSIRLWIATAPCPRSQDSTYSSATSTLPRNPSGVT